MLSLSKAVTALEGLPAATRMISSSIAALQEAGDESRSPHSRVRPSRPESYRAWGEQVYRSNMYAPEPGRSSAQHSAVQPQRQQRREGGSNDRHPRRRQQHQSDSKPMPPPRRQPGPGYDGYEGFRGNIIDREETKLEAQP